jgi:SpoVK/Ycf46/Vps4 family AAA+-type ATPase
VTSALRLSPVQARRAARSATLQAAMEQRPVDAADVTAGVRAQNGAALERLATRRPLRLTWADLVLPEAILAQLRQLVERSRWLPQVAESWHLGGQHGRRGIAALFSGPSGTGKTTSAEVVASALGLDLYVVNLAMVVDKYIGETEKNLERIFEEAEGVNGVLLFDEADALFGKRSEVSDARDRYANIETAYLLQRMERFDGIAILATNLRSNLDDAFTRRLDGIVEFPLPEPVQRERLWRHFVGRLPLAGDVDLAFCARAFALSGGSIHAIALGVAMTAAAGRRDADMGDVVRSVAAEYRKLGRLCHESEFGQYSRLLDPSAARPSSR